MKKEKGLREDGRFLLGGGGGGYSTTGGKKSWVERDKGVESRAYYQTSGEALTTVRQGGQWA